MVPTKKFLSAEANFLFLVYAKIREHKVGLPLNYFQAHLFG